MQLNMHPRGTLLQTMSTKDNTDLESAGKLHAFQEALQNVSGSRLSVQ